MVQKAGGLVLVVSLVLSLIACGDVAPVVEHLAVPDGKADDYRSTVGAEFDAEGQVTIVLSEQDAALDEQARREKLEALARSQIDALSNKLSAELSSRFPEAQAKRRAGVVVMLREAATAFDTLEPVTSAERTYAFVYRAEVGATNNLLSRLPLLDSPTGSKVRGLHLELAQHGETPAQRVAVTIKPSVTVRDAYPRYRELFEDGLEIYLHYGGDYNDARYDLRKARAMFALLGELGFEAPVKRFDELALDSGPFTRALDVDGERVDVRVTIVHADMAADDQLERLIDAYKQNAKTADVVVYAGHAGTQTSYSGVAVHYKPRKALPASEFRKLELPERYQLFMFSGCETYTGYADQLLAHPNKNARTADIITAVNFTPSARDVISPLLSMLVDQRDGTWRPHSWDAILEALNDEASRSWVSVFGVHGISDNPKLSPLAKPETLGRGCEVDADCPGIDNLCIQPLPLLGRKQCGLACTDHAGCPEGSRCWRVFTALTETTRQCVANGGR